MSVNFKLHKQLQADTYEILGLNLCKVLLMNNSLFPWVILVPQRDGLREIIDLSAEEQILLMKEIAEISKAMKKIFSPDKLNIAALGNVVEQLHIHVMARYKNDKAWPKPVFGCEVEKYGLKDVENLRIKFREYFNVR